MAMGKLGPYINCCFNALIYMRRDTTADINGDAKYGNCHVTRSRPGAAQEAAATLEIRMDANRRMYQAIEHFLTPF